VAKKTPTGVKRIFACTVIMVDDQKATFDQPAHSLKEARDACTMDTRIKRVLSVVPKT